MFLDEDRKKLMALARASEVFIALEHIRKNRDHLRQLMKNHDMAIASNREKRDCDTFHARLRELALMRMVEKEVRGF